jgi:hypothetical protein
MGGFDADRELTELDQHIMNAVSGEQYFPGEGFGYNM